MGDNWISRIVVGAVAQPVANAVASAGGFAGSAVGGVGNAINGVGKGIETGIRYYGDGVKDYGNAIQDWTKAGGARQGTANNPLGLSSNSVGGKLAFTGAKSKPQTKKDPIKAPRGDPRIQPSQTKALPAPTARKTAPSKAPATKPTTKTTLPASTAKPKTTTSTTGKKKISAESRPESIRAQPKTGSVPKKSYGVPSGAAKNPLGL